MTSVSSSGASGYLGSGYCGGNSIPTSSIGEQEVVFGGTDRLAEQMRTTAEIIDADLFAVITGCTAEIVGDDVLAVIRDYNKGPGQPPAILISGAGFKGDSLWGYDAALEALFRNYVEHTTVRIKGHVNIWGVPPAQDVWWYGNLLEIRRLLEGLGLHVNTFFTSRDSLPEIRSAASAELNIVLSPVHGISAAKAFEETHGTPYVLTDLPIGAKATRAFLYELEHLLHLDHALVEGYATQQDALYYHAFNRLADAYSDIDLQRYAIVIGTIDYAHALARFATRELGWIPELVVVTESVATADQSALRKRFEGFLENPDRTVVFETDTSRMAGHLAERWPGPNGSKYHLAFSPAFVLGSRLDRDFAESIGAGHLSVSYPVSNRVVLNRGYAGYNGALSLVEDIYSVVLAGR
jgi:nitrogenase molybdenum-iron protein beta chain